MKNCGAMAACMLALSSQQQHLPRRKQGPDRTPSVDNDLCFGVCEGRSWNTPHTTMIARLLNHMFIEGEDAGIYDTVWSEIACAIASDEYGLSRGGFKSSRIM
uniref:Uncharacterized protein n=1 Tax=Entomoneis paludosa TaxID=265537 RepID=A0A7S3DV32_9STRA|mmetsp:Transcript_39659/g.82420  ORF Transcript_39659/g.82420 Transcript_39659/m.82420 type:complete len:103 (+) Transcript_39659:1121-1429(+)